MIARIWKGAVRKHDGDAYAEYMRNTGIAEYAATPGNRGVWMLRRDLDEQTEFLMFTLWDSLAAVRTFAGQNYETAVFYPEDDRFLVERDPLSTHYFIDTHISQPDRGEVDDRGQIVRDDVAAFNRDRPVSQLVSATHLPLCWRQVRREFCGQKMVGLRKGTPLQRFLSIRLSRKWSRVKACAPTLWASLTHSIASRSDSRSARSCSLTLRPLGETLASSCDIEVAERMNDVGGGRGGNGNGQMREGVNHVRHKVHVVVRLRQQGL